MFRTNEKPIVVRVQDKHHEGVLTSARDTVMKQILEWNDCVVVDLNWYECHFLWEEEKNNDSISEVIIALENEGMIKLLKDRANYKTIENYLIENF